MRQFLLKKKESFKKEYVLQKAYCKKTFYKKAAKKSIKNPQQFINRPFNDEAQKRLIKELPAVTGWRGARIPRHHAFQYNEIPFPLMIQKLLQTNYRNKALDTTVIKRNCDKSQEAKSTNFYCTRFQKDICETDSN